jgi:hypothetical protein
MVFWRTIRPFLAFRYFYFFKMDLKNQRPMKILSVAWTSPNTLLGLLIGAVGLLTGGKAQLRRGCIEFHGGMIRWLLRKAPFGMEPMALTLGHTILGQTDGSLDLARDHEQIHVRQYERWGPLFLIAYLASSAWLWWIGKDAYHDNPFEIEAYTLTAPSNINR